MRHYVRHRGTSLSKIEEKQGGGRQDPAIELMMKHVEAGEIEFGEITREFLPLRRYGVTVTVEMMAKAIETIKDYKRRFPPDAPKPKRPDVVYYMRVGNRVKIGTSTNLVERLRNFNPEELMATEPGGPKVERRRHKEFAHLRVNGEWFKLESPLIEHIEQLQANW